MKQRVRGAKFQEHFSQAQLFYNSLAAHEKQHLIDALSFEYAALSEVFRGERRWWRMHEFVASNKYCRSHESAALDSLARKALLSVEEIAVNSVAMEMERTGEWYGGDNWDLLLAYMR